MSDTLFDPDSTSTLKPWQRSEPRTLYRVSDPDTSAAAAVMLGGRAGTMRRTLLDTFKRGDWTSEEASDLAGYTAADGAWKRVSDLLNADLLEPTGETRPAKSGSLQRVLRITNLGTEALSC